MDIYYKDVAPGRWRRRPGWPSAGAAAHGTFWLNTGRSARAADVALAFPFRSKGAAYIDGLLLCSERSTYNDFLLF